MYPSQKSLGIISILCQKSRLGLFEMTEHLFKCPWICRVVNGIQFISDAHCIAEITLNVQELGPHLFCWDTLKQAIRLNLPHYIHGH